MLSDFNSSKCSSASSLFVWYKEEP